MRYIKAIGVAGAVVCCLTMGANTAYAKATYNEEVRIKTPLTLCKSIMLDQRNSNQSGWHKEHIGWFYYNEDGSKETGWKKIGNAWYYFSEIEEGIPGLMASDEKKVINGNTYFFGTSGKMLTGWIKKPEGWYYTEKSGAQALGWKKVGKYWYYLDSNNEEYPGIMVFSSKKEINGKNYFFKDSGEMLTGWAKRPEGWYYAEKNGAQVLGWKKVGSYWYYLDSNNEEYPGIMVFSRKKEINGKNYFFKDSGEMFKGWVKYPEGWYYTDDSGRQMTGWIVVGNIRYYLDYNNEEFPGLMNVESEKEIDGKTYYFKENGAMKTGWIKLPDGWCYLDKLGEKVTGWQRVSGYWYYLRPSDYKMISNQWENIDGKMYYFKQNGVMASGWCRVGEHWYYLDKNGVMQTGWIAINGKWYYMLESGEMVTGWYELGGTWYYLKADGSMVTGWNMINGKWYFFSLSGAWDSSRRMEDTFIGVTRKDVVNELSAHRYDSYYLGTRYVPLSSSGAKDPCMHPNGSPGANGYTGMNCTGFVAFVFRKCGGNLSQIDAMGRGGGYVNAINWLDYTKRTGRPYYVYNSVSQLLAGGKAQKGDIIYCEPDWSKPGADCHIGIFWGDNSWNNVFWHQVGTNMISNIKAGTPQIRYYLIKTGV